MGQQARADISRYSFEEFVAFLFDQDLPSKGEKRNPWYWQIEVTFEPALVCAYYVRLFRQPTFLLKRFSREQLESGFWAIQGSNFACSVFCVIWIDALPLSVRQECVRSMFDLFRGLFAIEPLDTAAQMWWDSFCFEWHCGNRDRRRGGEDLSMQDTMFETLTSILNLSSPFCQRAALHGLGHLHHPDTEHLVRQYLKENPSLTNEQREYALAAARFEVL